MFPSGRSVDTTRLQCHCGSVRAVINFKIHCGDLPRCVCQKPKFPVACLQCGEPPKSRGLCDKCYWQMLQQVNAGLATWPILAWDKKALPRRRKKDGVAEPTTGLVPCPGGHFIDITPIQKRDYNQ